MGDYEEVNATRETTFAIVAALVLVGGMALSALAAALVAIILAQEPSEEENLEVTDSTILMKLHKHIMMLVVKEMQELAMLDLVQVLA